MIPITDKVSNAIVRYNRVFNTKFRIADIPANYASADVFAAEMETAIANKEPNFGGTYTEPSKQEKSKKTRRKEKNHM